MELALWLVFGLFAAWLQLRAFAELSDLIAGFKVVRITDPELVSAVLTDHGVLPSFLRFRIHSDAGSVPKRHIVSAICFLAISVISAAVFLRLST
ncbi:MAG: hypothetical protein IH945_13230, partial [Armatimonadetes bacterium]|nr:hypothetical protein [Armatimonadota bacterium]